jgi:hypothetical protein
MLGARHPSARPGCVALVYAFFAEHYVAGLTAGAVKG